MLLISLQALHDQQYSSMFDVYNEVGRNGTRGAGGIEPRPANPMPRQRKEDTLPRMPRTPGRHFKDVYYSTPSFTFSGSNRQKPPPIERKLECTLEELCRGSKKEINFTRDLVTKEGIIIQKQETQTIRVKPGWKKGTKITFEGMGDERPGKGTPEPKEEETEDVNGED